MVNSVCRRGHEGLRVFNANRRYFQRGHGLFFGIRPQDPRIDEAPEVLALVMLCRNLCSSLMLR